MLTGRYQFKEAESKEDGFGYPECRGYFSLNGRADLISLLWSGRAI